MSRAVIISAGSITSYDYISSFISEDDYVICADGGYAHACRMGIVPDLTLGDFDSWTGIVSGEKVTFSPEKDYTDTELAVNAALEKGFDEILLLGATGTRLDHTLANIGLLEKIAKMGARGYLVDEHNTVTVICSDAEIEPEEGMHLSLIPVGTVSKVTLENLRYTLKATDLHFSETLAVSNEFKDGSAVIKFKEGSLIVIKARD